MSGRPVWPPWVGAILGNRAATQGRPDKNIPRKIYWRPQTGFTQCG